MKKKKIIPKFKNFKEEAEFWDFHSAADYLDGTENAPIVFEVRDKPRDETLILRLQKDVKTKLEEKAREKGLNISTLARMWLIEKLNQSRSVK